MEACWQLWVRLELAKHPYWIFCQVLYKRAPPNQFWYAGYRRVGVSGSVSVDGKTMSAGDRFMRRIAGYVQQDDVLPGTSTVFEYLLFNAALRMPRDVTRHQKEKRVFNVLRQLGLTKVAHNFVGDQFTRGLSGVS